MHAAAVQRLVLTTHFRAKQKRCVRRSIADLAGCSFEKPHFQRYSLWPQYRQESTNANLIKRPGGGASWNMKLGQAASNMKK
jgi:hypothetical protein